MRRFRYRTPVLTGPWRDSHEEAMRDAVRSKQAELDEDQLNWIVPGQIEVRNNEAAPRSVKS